MQGSLKEDRADDDFNFFTTLVGRSKEKRGGLGGGGVGGCGVEILL